MLYAVRMEASLPRELTDAERTDLIERERAYCQDVQRGGEWLHIWRCAGQYANLSILDVLSNDRLHEIISGLPLFPYLSIEVTPLAHHPSDLRPAS